MKKGKRHFLGRDIGVFLFFILLIVVSYAKPLAADTVTETGDVNISAVVLDTGQGTTADTTGTGTSTGGSGGGSGGVYIPPTTITFSGYAYPRSDVFILQDGQEITQTIANLGAQFSASLSNVHPGTYTFSVVAEDSLGYRSTLFTFPFVITANTATSVNNIFLSPSIKINKQSIKVQETVTTSGETVPGALLTLTLLPEKKVYTTYADPSGKYSYVFPAGNLSLGAHTVQTQATINGSQKSANSILVGFVVGFEFFQEGPICQRADINCDGRINLVDFSILAYWYKKPNPPKKVDLNSDHYVDLADFSILAYYWSG